MSEGTRLISECIVSVLYCRTNSGVRHAAVQTVWCSSWSNSSTSSQLSITECLLAENSQRNRREMVCFSTDVMLTILQLTDFIVVSC